MSRGLLAAVVLLGAALPARAHRLQLELRREGPEVVVELFFADGTLPEGATIVIHLDGQELLRGASDAQGSFRFAPPGPGHYRVVATDPGLHRVEGELHVAGSPDEPAAGEPAAGEPASVASAVAASATHPGAAPRASIPWGRAGGGLAVIAALAGLLHLVQRARRGADAE